MLKKMEIIPAIDIIDGKCVRLKEGDFSKKNIYHIHPVEIAKRFEASGITRLHLVDLDGAKNRYVTNKKVLEDIATHTSLKIDFGGGINSIADIKDIFNAGANLIAIGTIAIKNKTLWKQMLEKFGTAKFLLGADVLNEKIKIAGWLEETQIHLNDFLNENLNLGVENIFITDISKDGLLKGTSITLYKKTIQQFPSINLIASGGISSLKDLDLLLKIGCRGAIIGKALYEQHISLLDLKKYL